MPKNVDPAMEGSFRCSRCKETKPFDQFTTNRTRYNGRASTCKPCAVKVTAEWQKNNPEKVAARNKRWKDAHPEQVATRNAYTRIKRREFLRQNDPNLLISRERASTCQKRGVTPNWYEAKMEEQGGKCSICGRSDNYSRKNFSIDHDHKCCDAKSGCAKCVRGLLCNICNNMLHRLEHMEDWTYKALLYLDRHANK